jgi:hypothetical protein
MLIFLLMGVAMCTTTLRSSLKKMKSPSEIMEKYIYGSVKGYMTVEEVTDLYSQIAKSYPELDTKYSSVGKSFEGKDMMMLEIGRGNVDSISMISLMHARELISLSHHV